MNESDITDVSVKPAAEEPSNDKRSSSKDMIAKIKKQNPGAKIKRAPGGGIQIMNPRAPSSLLTNLIKRLGT
jgi:hypothetical protein